MAIVFNIIKVGGLKANSTVSVGTNHEFEWSNNRKNNLGFGTMYGENYSINALDMVYDDDTADGIIIDLSVIGQEQL